ncbi:LysR family transcriptional regulator [Mesorhizobium escarrei]|uniref:DNA-binding transcriptional LysR family regulator n=1 Tax=Mesorhizobium escarrei TaxID=666018 RepID=A0ABM9EFH1_9HYPH|nr:LysR family transcriptional regulator [Mesorhizobium escarrei]CAH2408098.1 DNA-binding transcriptional LysR family regulator [Mesorhizobium escarrei]
MDRIQDLHLFRTVVRAGSLTSAGNHLGLSPAAMSGRLKALEAHYGVSLLKRSTRSMNLTPEGRLLFENSDRVIEEFDTLEATLRRGGSDLRGSITLTCPSDLGRQHVAGMVDEFLAENPEIQLRMFLTDNLLDIVETGCDVAIRYGNLPDSALTTRRLGPNRRLICCAPAYAERHGMPATPHDLAQHNCLTLLRSDRIMDEWEFVRDGETTTVRVQGDRMSSDGFALRQMAMDGVGLVRKSLWDVADDLKSGRLLSVLDDYTRSPFGFHLLTDHRTMMPRRIRLFIDFAVRYFKRLSGELAAYV